MFLNVILLVEEFFFFFFKWVLSLYTFKCTDLKCRIHLALINLYIHVTNTLIKIYHISVTPFFVPFPIKFSL